VRNHIAMAIVLLFGWLRDFLNEHVFTPEPSAHEQEDLKDFVPLYTTFERFFVRNVIERGYDVLHRPVCTVPGAVIDIRERKFSSSGKFLGLTGKVFRNVVNLGSYNYLGFAQNEGVCADAAVKAVAELGTGVCSNRFEVGNYEIHSKLERKMAEFLGVEDCMTFGMGFATNSMNIPCLVGKGCLVISDACNHASLAIGCKISGATIRVFKHNDMKDLEKILRHSIVEGHPRTYRSWKKILIIVEGIYSMEGTIVNLPEVIRLKKKYKAYVYLDEAHSIGSLGSRARGVTDYFDIDPTEIDVLMGTFTKSFGASGGYIAGRRELVEHLRLNSHSACYGVSMSPPVAQQALSSLNVIMSEEGKERITQLAANTRLFREKLRTFGFIVYGHEDSPVVPLLAYLPSHIACFSREMLARGYGVVVAGFPSTPLGESRVRFCISSALSKQQILDALEAISDIGDIMRLKISAKQILYKFGKLKK
uniref:serine C-palmitoyltransferase n=1 Tax=Ciona savignyi TaxID=51511 RepID=H2YZY6_CIOSA